MFEDGEDDASGQFVVLSDEEVERCLSTMTDLQHRALFRLMAETGMGIDEIVGNEDIGNPGIYIQDINSRTLSVEVLYRFTAKDKFMTRTVPISAACLVSIQDWLASMGYTLNNAGKLFRLGSRRIRQFLSEVSERSGVDKKVTTLVLRRTAMVNMLKQGLRPEEVRRRMGFIRTREDYVLSAIGYIVMDEVYYEKVLRQTMIDTIMQGPPPPALLQIASSAGSGGFTR